MTRIWLKPWAATLGLAVAAAIVVLNFAAAAFGAGTPWLVAVNLVANLTVLGAMIVVIVQAALRAEAHETHTQTVLEESHGRLAAVMDSGASVCTPGGWWQEAWAAKRA